MTDNEIIEALEYCKIGNCDDCPFYGIKEDCEIELPEESLAIINRQKAENERLKERISYLEESIDCSRKKYNSLLQKLQQAQSKAIREFVNRLTDKISVYSKYVDGDGIVILDRIFRMIEDIVKEMTEEK